MKRRSAIKIDLFAADHRREKIDRLGDPLTEGHLEIPAFFSESGEPIVIAAEFGSNFSANRSILEQFRRRSSLDCLFFGQSSPFRASEGRNPLPAQVDQALECVFRAIVTGDFAGT